MTSVAQFVANSVRYLLGRKVPGDTEATGGMKGSDACPENASLHGTCDVDAILSSYKSAGFCDIPDEMLAPVQDSSRKRVSSNASNIILFSTLTDVSGRMVRLPSQVTITTRYNCKKNPIGTGPIQIVRSQLHKCTKPR